MTMPQSHNMLCGVPDVQIEATSGDELPGEEVRGVGVLD